MQVKDAMMRTNPKSADQATEVAYKLWLESGNFVGAEG